MGPAVPVHAINASALFTSAAGDPATMTERIEEQ
jgi:hypothetical protein